MSVRADAPGDLLFDLLVLQTGLISKREPFAGFQTWAQANDRSMADVLVEQAGLDGSIHRAFLEGLVGAHLRLQGGEVEKRLAALKVGASTRESLRTGARSWRPVERVIARKMLDADADVVVV